MNIQLLKPLIRTAREMQRNFPQKNNDFEKLEQCIAWIAAINDRDNSHNQRQHRQARGEINETTRLAVSPDPKWKNSVTRQEIEFLD